jgi:hypothetical protein
MDKQMSMDKRPSNQMSNSTASREMPRYQSHKIVHALKLRAVIFDIDQAKAEKRETDGSITLFPEDDKTYTPFKENERGFVSRVKATVEDPGYFVVYDDGYKSWSPTKAFEEGYTKI